MGRDRRIVDMAKTLEWQNDRLVLLDQTALPHQERMVECTTLEQVAEAIRGLQVRGAPAIGAAAAYGLVLGAREIHTDRREALLSHLEAAAQTLLGTRPTAVNLRWAIERMLAVPHLMPSSSVRDLRAALLREANAIAAEDAQINRAIGDLGAALVARDERILTYCNTGSLATVDYGTAFGIIRTAHVQGKRVHAFICETRPVLQGARLTTWEAVQLGVPGTLITDNAAGELMRRKMIDRVIVGADRIASNGDVANKIGTYTLAVLARAHEVPFIVAAPRSTIDLRAPDGASIPVEERRPEEVTHLAGVRVAPEGFAAMNPAFDITPHHLVTAIVTEAGVAYPPYLRSLRDLAAVDVDAARGSRMR